MPEYKQGRIKQYPVAFVSGKKPLVKAVIQADEECNARGERIWVKAKFAAKFTTHIEFGAVKGIVDNTTGQFLYENSGAAVFSNLPFTENKVVGLESATIMWYYQIVSEEYDNESAPVEELWSNFEDTATPLYVTYDRPETLPADAGGGRDYYHTLLARSCIPAHGRDNPSSIERGIWKYIKKLKTTRADDDAELYYYLSIGCGNTTTTDLITTTDGQCGSWAHFYIDLMRSVGVYKDLCDQDNYLTLRGEVSEATNFESLGFLVRNYKVNEGFQYNNLDPFYKYTLILDQYEFESVAEFGNRLMITGDYEILPSGITKLGGVKGQNNPNPKSIFDNHQVAIIDQKPRDPSYGSTYSLNANDYTTVFNSFNNTSVFGYFTVVEGPVSEVGLGYDVNNNGSMEANIEVFLILVSRTFSGFELRTDPNGGGTTPYVKQY